MPRPHIYPEIGTRYGKLTFIEPLPPVQKGFLSFAIGKFICDCGNEKVTQIRYVKRNTKSCGCNYSISNEINAKGGIGKHKNRPTGLIYKKRICN